MTKVRVISSSAQRFAGLNFIADCKEYKGLLALIDSILGKRSGKGGGYSFSEVCDVFFKSILAGATSIEDVNLLASEFEQTPFQKTVSADTILRTFARLSAPNEKVIAKDSGAEYVFNRNKQLVKLLVRATVSLGLLKKGQKCDFDYDNQIIPTEKRDARMTYKDTMGYAPGIAFANGNPIAIEGRDGNANVTLDQAATLRNAYEALLSEGIKVRNSRMDGGSYTKEAVAMALRYSERIYIRAKRSAYQTSIVNESTGGWRRIKLCDSKGHTRKMDVRSLETEDFIKGERLRVVIYRFKDEEIAKTLFKDDEEMKYRYFSILTNDFESREEKIVAYYNKRGNIERVFDQMNNDFNWSHLPSSEMSRNTVFMLLTALLRNFYTKFVEKLSDMTGHLISKKSRLKRFILSFVTCPAQWVQEKTGWVLNLYGPTPLQRRYVALANEI